MKELIYWGNKGEYGPFTKQDDGWPNAGEIIRYYRRKQSISAEELARQYGEAIHNPVTARWILKMEQQNKVPTDVTRRRILAKILNIPPYLLGLASLEVVLYHRATEKQEIHSSTILKQTSLADLTTYEQYIRDRWLLSYTGEETFDDIEINIWELELFERQGGGNLQKRIWEVLNAHYQLASDITRHQGRFPIAWSYANQAVRVTRLLGVKDLLAAALYRRGYTSLEWAIFGDKITSGIMNQEPDKEKMQRALSDFEEALPHAHAQLKGAVWLEMSRAHGLSQQTLLSMNTVRQAENIVATGNGLADPLEQILLEGALNGLSEGMYLLGKAASLITLGRTTTALDVLDDLEDLQDGKGIVRNQARRLAYADLLRAEASLGQKDYITAAIRAKNALQIFQDIRTLEKIAWINTLCRKLLAKSGNHQEVKSLEKMLNSYYKRIVTKTKHTE